MQIKNIVFDFGGIIFPLTFDRAVQRFKEIGLTQADTLLDRYKQSGIFGELEDGSISPELFLERLSQMAGRPITPAQCQYAWMGYVGEVPQQHFDALQTLKDKGYQLSLLSNINPYVMDWAFAENFDRCGHNIHHYFPTLFLSFQCGVMKPATDIFQQVIKGTGFDPAQTLFIDDGIKNIEAAKALGFQTFHSQQLSDWVEQVNLLPTLQ